MACDEHKQGKSKILERLRGTYSQALGDDEYRHDEHVLGTLGKQEWPQ